MTKTRTGVFAAAAAAAALALGGAGASPAQAATCNPKSNSYPGVGYWLSPFRTTGFSCSGAYKVRAAHYKCRTRNSKTGRCSSFNGWRCSETRNNGASSYIGTVTCRKSGRKLVYRYEQDK